MRLAHHFDRPPEIWIPQDEEVFAIDGRIQGKLRIQRVKPVAEPARQADRPSGWMKTVDLHAAFKEQLFDGSLKTLHDEPVGRGVK